MRFDLHMHTQYSDGELTSSELLSKAKKIGLDGVSITDHDTLGAYPQAFIEGDKLGLKVLSGIEISCLHHQKSVHVLGYAISMRNIPFLTFIEKCQEKRKARNVLILKKLKEQGIVISPQEICATFQKKLEVSGRPHLAELLVRKGVCKDVYEAFNVYLGDGKKCYVVGHRPSVEEAIEALHNARAFAVIAHPHLVSDDTLMDDLLAMPFDGLEGYYAKFLPHQEKKWVKIAEDKQWLVTGGSDFHGSSKPVNELGCSWVGPETFNKLYERQKENE